MQLSDELLLGGPPETERELLKRARQFTRLLERKLGRRPPSGNDVIDLERLRSRRAVMSALGVSAPDPRPPRAPRTA